MKLMWVRVMPLTNHCRIAVINPEWAYTLGSCNNLDRMNNHIAKVLELKP